FNAGDANQDGILNPGETWQYTVSYTVTQGDIDNGGVVQAGLTHDDTATVLVQPSLTDSDTHSVTIVRDPHLTLTKTAAVADGTGEAGLDRRGREQRADRAGAALGAAEDRSGCGWRGGRRRRRDRLRDDGGRRRQHDADRRCGERCFGHQPDAYRRAQWGQHR